MTAKPITAIEGLTLAHDAVKRRYPNADIPMELRARTHCVKNKPFMRTYRFAALPSVYVVVPFREQVAIVLDDKEPKKNFGQAM